MASTPALFSGMNFAVNKHDPDRVQRHANMLFVSLLVQIVDNWLLRLVNRNRPKV